MEERTLQTNQQEGPTTFIEAPSPPQVPFSGDAPALYSGDESDEGELEFEFPFVSRDSPAGTGAPADELFADGRIRPFYPVFGRGAVHGHDGTAQSAPAAPRIRGQLGRLFLEESRARSSSTSSSTSTASSAATEDDGGGLEGALPESYCLWTPGSVSSAPASASSSPRPPRKSSSTGSMARWRRISQVVVGRSHSDGKEKFQFLPTPPHEAPRPKNKPNPAGGRKASSSAASESEVDTVTTAHRIAYIAKGGGGGTPRRTFLPYREELVGFFANVNGISRSRHHPF